MTTNEKIAEVVGRIRSVMDDKGMWWQTMQMVLGDALTLLDSITENATGNEDKPEPDAEGLHAAYAAGRYDSNEDTPPSLIACTKCGQRFEPRTTTLCADCDGELRDIFDENKAMLDFVQEHPKAVYWDSANGMWAVKLPKEPGMVSRFSHLRDALRHAMTGGMDVELDSGTERTVEPIDDPDRSGDGDDNRTETPVASQPDTPCKCGHSKSDHNYLMENKMCRECDCVGYEPNTAEIVAEVVELLDAVSASLEGNELGWQESAITKLQSVGKQGTPDTPRGRHGVAMPELDHVDTPAPTRRAVEILKACQREVGADGTVEVVQEVPIVDESRVLQEDDSRPDGAVDVSGADAELTHRNRIQALLSQVPQVTIDKVEALYAERIAEVADECELAKESERELQAELKALKKEMCDD